MAEQLVFSAIMEDGITPILEQISNTLTQIAESTQAMADQMTAAFTGLDDILDTVNVTLDETVGSFDAEMMAIQESTAAVLENTDSLIANSDAQLATADSTNKATASYSMFHGALWAAMIASVAYIGQSIQGAAQFNNDITTVKALAYQGTMSIQQLSEAAIQMGMQFGISPDLVAKSMYQVMSSITDTSKAWDLLSVAMKGAAATGIDANVWTKILTSTVNDFGISATQASDTIIAMLTKADVPAQQIVTSFGRMLTGSIEGSVGIDQMAAAFATLTVQGDSARQSEMLLGSTMNTVQNNGKQFQANIEKLGGSFDLAYYNSLKFTEKLFYLQGIANDLNVPLVKLFTSVQYGGIATLLMAHNGDILSKKLSDIDGTTNETQNAFQTMTQSVQYNWHKMTADMQSMWDAAITYLRPSINGLLNALSATFENIANFIVKHSATINANLGKIGEAFRVLGPLIALAVAPAVIGGLEKMVGLLLTLSGMKTIGNIAGALSEIKIGDTKGLSAVGDIFKGLYESGDRLGIILMRSVGSGFKFVNDTALHLYAALPVLGDYLRTGLANGMLYVDAAVRGLNSGIRAFWGGIGTAISWMSNWRNWFSLLQGGLGLLADGFTELMPALLGLGAAAAPILLIAGAITLLVVIFINFRTQALSVLQTLAGALAPGFHLIQTAITSALNNIKSTWDSVWPKLQPAIINLLNAAKSMAPAFQVLGNVVGAVLSIIINVIGIVVSAFIRALPTIANIFAGIFRIIGQLGSLVQAIFSGQFGKIPGILGGIFGNILNLFRNLLTMGVGFILNLVNGILNYIGQLPVRAIQLVVQFVSGIVTWFRNLFMQLVGGSIVPDMVNGIISWIGQLPGRAIAFIVSMVTSIVSRMFAFAGQMLSTAGQAVDSVVNALAGLAGRALSQVINATASVTNEVGSWPGKLANLAEQAISSLVNSIKNGVGEIGKAAQNLGGSLLSNLKGALHIGSPSRDMLEIGDNINSSLAQGILDSQHKAINAAVGTVGKVGAAYGITPSAASGAAGGLYGSAAGGARVISLTINVQTNGGMSAGFQMLNPTDRRRFATDIANELGIKANLQTNLGAGYAASR